MKTKSLLFLALALVLSLCLALVACDDKNGGQDNGVGDNTVTTVKELSAENGVENPECRMDILFLQNP